MQVRIQYPHYLAKEDFDRLSPTKKHYWMKCMDTQKFIEYADYDHRASCDAPVDLTCEVPCGTYCMGAGDKNVMRLGKPDWPARCFVWFYVANDGAHVVPKMADLPSMADIEAFNAQNPLSAPETMPVQPAKTAENGSQTTPNASPNVKNDAKTTENAENASDSIEVPLPNVIFVPVDDAWYCPHEGFSVLESSPVCEAFEFAPDKGAARTCANCIFALSLFTKSNSS